MRSFYVRRKDLDHVPFQFYVRSDGTAVPLDPGYTGVFALIPPRDGIDVFYVQILDKFIREMGERWDIAAPDLLRIAARGVEAWLKNEPIPADHLYGPEWLKIDRNWYPREPDGSPAMALDPYNFEVHTDEPWVELSDWDQALQRDGSAGNPTGEPQTDTAPAPPPVSLVFGYTLDVFPIDVILGYEQLKRKVADAGLRVQVVMLPLTALPPRVHTLIVPLELAEAARLAAPGARVHALHDMLNQAVYHSIVKELADEHAPAAEMMARR